MYGGLTKTETHPQVGTAAVDTRVFPFGTQFKIPHYGYAIARDTGGLIKGRRLDLVFSTCKSALAWGYRVYRISYRLFPKRK